MSNFKRFGYTWEDGYDGWVGDNGGRFHPITWRFGNIWQCVVSTHEKGTHGNKSEGLWMCLEPRTTMNDAMKHDIEWINWYNKTGPQSVEETMKECYEHYPTLYRTRLDVIDHIFFVIGNGYQWFDGAVISATEFDPEVHARREAEYEEQNKTIEELYETLLKIAEKQGNTQDIKKFASILKRRNPQIGPISEEERTQELIDEGRANKDYQRTFYPVSENYSAICLVPDDVRPDWLELAYEAAKALRESPADPRYDTREQNPKIGERVCRELEERFPQLKEK